MQSFRLSEDYAISRVIRGGWQMASGHGNTPGEDPIADMVAYADAGVTTFDCADIYTGVEELIGQFRRRYLDLRGAEAAERIHVHTKCVPDLDRLADITRADIERSIDRSLKRLGVERLDLVQFHWWDYAAPRWLEVAGWLADLVRAGKIRHLGGTNFDTEHVAAFAAAGIPLVSMQVQYSLLDRRPAKAMAGLAAREGLWFLCYGTVAGGFLSDRWHGQPEPAGGLENRSLVKYKLIIDEFGGWDLFQALLACLRAIADRHDSDIASVASAVVLDWPRVAGVIVGSRSRAHLAGNLKVADLALSADDRMKIDAVLGEAKALPGDVYTLERDRTGRHGAIMKYNLGEAKG